MNPKSDVIFAMSWIVVVLIISAGMVCVIAVKEVVESIVWLALIGGGFGTLWLMMILRAVGKIRRIRAEQRDYPQITVSGQYEYLEVPKRSLLSWRRK